MLFAFCVCGDNHDGDDDDFGDDGEDGNCGESRRGAQAAQGRTSEKGNRGKPAVWRRTREPWTTASRTSARNWKNACRAAKEGAVENRLAHKQKREPWKSGCPETTEGTMEKRPAACISGVLRVSAQSCFDGAVACVSVHFRNVVACVCARAFAMPPHACLRVWRANVRV